MSQISYFNTSDALVNSYRKYNTQALILSNYELGIENKSIYLGTDLLMTYIINNLDLDLSNYYKWLYSTKDILPASNAVISIDENGKIYNTNLLKGEMKNIYDLREQMQYRFFIK